MIENSADVVWHWVDEFSDLEKGKLKAWLIPTLEATQKTLGTSPFDVHLHMHRKEKAKEPVPWANTWRYPHQSIHFHVDPSYKLEAFLNDWTAPHEMSHLALPHLGEDHAWFAEGFASFMQAQVMRTMGIYTDEDVKNKYVSKVTKAMPLLDSPSPPAELFRELRKQHEYPAFYWGGATYFMRLHEMLKEKGSSGLPELVQRYMECCRKGSRRLSDVLASWDRLLDSTACQSIFNEYSEQPCRNVVSKALADTY